MAARRKARTRGLSPKFWAALVSTEATFLVGQTILELPAWVMLVAQAVIVGAAVFTAGPGSVEPDH